MKVVTDALAVGAVFSTGGSSECTPPALTADVPHGIFGDKYHGTTEIRIEWINR